MEYRSFIRELRRFDRGHNPVPIDHLVRAIADNFSPETSAAKVLDQSVEQGYLLVVEGNLELTAKARSFSTKRAKRMSSKALASLKQGVMDRIYAAIREPSLVLEVGRMYLLGSALDPTRADYGDLDICFDRIHKADFSDWKAAMDHARKLAEPRGISSWNIEPDSDLEKFIRARRGSIHIVAQYEMENMKMPRKLIYESPRYAAMKPESQWL